jgi:hypothetical protein
VPPLASASSPAAPLASRHPTWIAPGERREGEGERKEEKRRKKLREEIKTEEEEKKRKKKRKGNGKKKRNKLFICRKYD